MSEASVRLPPRWVMRAQWRAHKLLWNASGGRLGGRVVGMPVLELETVGRVSGEPRRVLLTYVATPEGPAVIASNAGASTPPAWYRNLQANPRVRVREAGRWTDAVTEELTGEPRERAWDDASATYPGYRQYAEHIAASAAQEGTTPRPIPVVLLRRTG